MNTFSSGDEKQAKQKQPTERERERETAYWGKGTLLSKAIIMLVLFTIAVFIPLLVPMEQQS